MPEKIPSNLIETISLKATKWIGSTASLVTHTVIFIICGIVILAGAIYLSIFIQMSVNRNETTLAEVSEDIDEIQEDVEEIQEDIDEIQEDVDEIHDEIEEDPDTKHLEHIKKTLAALIKEMELLHTHTDKTSQKKLK